MPENTLYPHVSVDCVVLGFDGSQFNVLLLKRTGIEGSQTFNDLKLPGGLIFSDENLDDAAHRIVGEHINTNALFLKQFKSFGSPSRTSHPRDVHWLEKAVQLKIGRIVTVGYLALLRISSTLRFHSKDVQAIWVPLQQVGTLAFDHNQIVEEAVREVCEIVVRDPSTVFNLLPKRFTASQMRVVYEALFGQPLDVRNFHKKMSRMPYVVPLDEFEKQVAHRAARYYRFDKKIYFKVYGGFYPGRSSLYGQ